MGLAISKFRERVRPKEKKRVLMLGLDAAGKTTILYKLKRGEPVTEIPTIGFAVENLDVDFMNLTSWDAGGRSKIRPLWRHYYEGTSALIWVVDSADKERFEQAKDELQECLAEDRLKDATLLVFANKQDLPYAKTVVEIGEALGLAELSSKRKWLIQPCCASTGQGVWEGFDWLMKDLYKQS